MDKKKKGVAASDGNRKSQKKTFFCICPGCVARCIMLAETSSCLPKWKSECAVSCGGLDEK